MYQTSVSRCLSAVVSNWHITEIPSNEAYLMLAALILKGTERNSERIFHGSLRVIAAQVG